MIEPPTLENLQIADVETSWFAHPAIYLAFAITIISALLLLRLYKDMFTDTAQESPSSLSVIARKTIYTIVIAIFLAINFTVYRWVLG